MPLPICRCVPLLVALALATGTAAATATDLVVVLPGQEFVPGVGLTGSPDPVTLRTPFTVRLVVVDAQGNIAYDYDGPLVTVSLPSDVPAPGVEPVLPRRLATAVSGAGAATSLVNGSLSLSLYGSPFRLLDLGSPSTGDDVCAAIESAVDRPPALQFEWERPLGFKCLFDPHAMRYTMFLHDGIPTRATVAVPLLQREPDPRLAIEPTAGDAPQLELGAPSVLPDPNDPADYWPRRLDPPPADDLRFSRGNAFLRMQVASFDAVGPGQLLSIDQGAGPALPVTASSFDVVSSSLEGVATTALGDGSGNINRMLIEFNEGLDPGAPVDPGEFALQQQGLPPLFATSVIVTSGTSLGYTGGVLDVTFGSGLARTDVDDVELHYASPTGLLGAETGTALNAFVFSPGSSPRLIDGAAPVLLGTFAPDNDGNGSPDFLEVVFSEPVHFSAGRGVHAASLTQDESVPVVPVPSFLHLTTVDRGVATQSVVTVVDPDDPAASSLSGHASIAAAIQRAVRGHTPSWAGFEAEFVDGRYVLRSGVHGSGSNVTVGVATGGADDLGLSLDFLGSGAIEEDGAAEGIADLDDWVVLSQDGRFNLLEGSAPGDFVIDQNTITIFLNNIAGSGTGAPVFVFRDRDGGFIEDGAPIPLPSAASNSLGLPPDFHPRELLTEALSTPGPDLKLLRTVDPGSVILDASASIPPLTSRDDDAIVEFAWRQLEGPLLPAPPPGELVSVVPAQAGTYVFELSVTVVDDASIPPLLNPFVEGDGELPRLLELNVVPGDQFQSVIVLPGQTLVPGSGVTGTTRVATVGVPYDVDVFLCDEFFNLVPAPPGTEIRLTTTDPGDVEPPFVPVNGSSVKIRITPTDAATTFIPEIDDEVLVAFDQGDVPSPYVVGSAWNCEASRTPGAPSGTTRLTWDQDPRAVQWNIYRVEGSRATDFDLDRDGQIDFQDFFLLSAGDPDPGDNVIDDGAIPDPGRLFLYMGSMVLQAFGELQETSLGVGSNGEERVPVVP